MSEFTKILCHARRLKSATKNLTSTELEEVKTKLEKVIVDRIAAEEKAIKANAEKNAKIEKYKKMMEADGINPGDLTIESLDKPAKRAPRPAKYEITTKDGEHVTWTGQGRMPNVFKAQVNAGKKMESFLIK